jgi:hypothetical protein
MNKKIKDNNWSKYWDNVNIELYEKIKQIKNFKNGKKQTK